MLPGQTLEAYVVSRDKSVVNEASGAFRPHHPTFSVKAGRLTRNIQIDRLQGLNTLCVYRRTYPRSCLRQHDHLCTSLLLLLDNYPCPRQRYVHSGVRRPIKLDANTTERPKPRHCCLDGSPWSHSKQVWLVGYTPLFFLLGFFS